MASVAESGSSIRVVKTPFQVHLTSNKIALSNAIPAAESCAVGDHVSKIGVWGPWGPAREAPALHPRLTHCSSSD